MSAVQLLQLHCLTLLPVMPLGLSYWHVSSMYLYAALYDLCDLIMCTTDSLDAHTEHFRYLDT